MNAGSRYKEVIIRILRNTKSHPTAEWVYRRVKREIPDVGMATIYRNLKSLTLNGEIAEIATTAGTNHFDGNVEQHYHFRCDICGRIVDIEEPVDNAIEARVAAKTGFVINRHTLELGGICDSCQRQRRIGLRLRRTAKDKPASRK